MTVNRNEPDVDVLIVQLQGIEGRFWAAKDQDMNPIDAVSDDEFDDISALTQSSIPDVRQAALYAKRVLMGHTQRPEAVATPSAEPA